MISVLRLHGRGLAAIQNNFQVFRERCPHQELAATVGERCRAQPQMHLRRKVGIGHRTGAGKQYHVSLKYRWDRSLERRQPTAQKAFRPPGLRRFRRNAAIRGAQPPQGF